MKHLLLPVAAAALVAGFATTPACHAQVTWQIGAINDNWSVDDNWDTFAAPFAQFDSTARIGAPEFDAGNPTGWAPDASVRAIGAVGNAPTVRLGDGAGTSGTLTVAAGNSLDVVATSTGGGIPISTGDVLVGIDGGVGVLDVSGTLTIANRLESPTSGDLQSEVRLSGSANVTAVSGFLDRQLRVVGPSVNFTTTGVDDAGNGLILGGGGTHTWEFGAAGPSKLNVSGNLDIGGVLAIATPGFTPSVGSRWAIAESATIDANDDTPSGFGFVDTSGVPNLLPGTVFQVRTGAAGTTGVLTEIEVVQEPVLVVNRQTGQATLKNFSPDASTLAFDAYTIRSNNGSLAAGNLNGLADAGTSPGQWFETNPLPTGVGELNVSDSIALAASQEVSLGAIFAPAAPAEFGQNNEDLSFDYGTADGGLFNAQVVYEGMPNDTLVLNVDPTTGQAQLLNPSAFEVGLDAYVISSGSGSLSETAWSSLDDQGASGGDWFEAPSDSERLSELLIDGSVTLQSSQGNVVGIGSPWSTSGEQDLVFEFALEGENFLRTGKVVYGDLVSPVALPGDFNGDNVVDAADYTVWRDAAADAVLPNDPTPGVVSDADRVVWASNYGATLAVSAAAVPEPAALASFATLLISAAIRRRRS